MRESLGKVSEVAVAGNLQFLGVEVEIARAANNRSQSFFGGGLLADLGKRGNHPEGADQEGFLLRRYSPSSVSSVM